MSNTYFSNTSVSIARLESVTRDLEATVKNSAFRNEFDDDVAGVYELVCTETGEKYVGSTKGLKPRLSAHFSQLKRKVHPNARLQSLYDEYGRESFAWYLLEAIDDKDTRLDVEQAYIDSGEYDLNHSPSARGGHFALHNEEAKRKMSLAKTGENHPQFKGYFVTPWGKFTSANQAAKASPNGGVSSPTLNLWCTNPEGVVTRAVYGHSKYLLEQEDETAIGKTYGELGFGFEPVTTH